MAQLDMVCYEHNRTDPNNRVEPAKAIRLAATHQIDKGFKPKTLKPGWVQWGGSASQIDEPVSAFSDQDAAHFSNLGVAPSASLAFDGNRASPVLREMKREIENIHGNTKLMPKTYNITTDAVVDDVHFQQAIKLMNAAALSGPQTGLYMIDKGQRHEKEWKPFASQAGIRDYVVEARKALKAKRDAYNADGRTTETDCCDAYIDALAQPEFSHDVFKTVYTNVLGEASQYEAVAGTEAGPRGAVSLFFDMT